MAKATRGQQLIRTDRSTPGQVTFYDARKENAQAGKIGTLSLRRIAGDEGYESLNAAIARAAIHGYTQNLLDSSNKLDGDDRVAFIARGIEILHNEGWVAAPVDDEKAKAGAIAALEKMYAVMPSEEIREMIANLRNA